MKILVADDDRVHVHLASSCLRTKGFEVLTAFDAMQTWMAVMKGGIDVVILGIRMPGGTGVEVLRKLKTFTKTSMVQVIVLSGSIDPHTVPTVKDLGADEFLPKPVQRRSSKLRPGCGPGKTRSPAGGSSGRS